MSVILMRLSGAFLLNCELFALTLLFALPLGLAIVCKECIDKLDSETLAP